MDFGIGEAAIGVGLLLAAAFFFVVVAPDLISATSSLPGPLSAFGTWLGNTLASLRQRYLSWLDSAASGFEGLFHTWMDRIVATIGEIVHTQADTINQANAAPSQAVNAVTQTIVPPLQAQIQTGIDYTTSVQSALDTEANTLAGQIEDNHAESRHWVDNLSQNVQAFNDWAVSQLQAHTATEQADHAESRAWVDNLSQNVQAFNAWTVQQLQAQAGSIAQVESEANQWAGLAQSNAESYAATAAAAAGTSAVGWVTANVLPEVQAVSSTLTTFLDRCGNPLCEGLLPSARALSTLAKLAGGVELIELVVAAIADPAGTSAAIISVVEPLARDALSELRAITGI
jgi:hypothetical protein